MRKKRSWSLKKMTRMNQTRTRNCLPKKMTTMSWKNQMTNYLRWTRMNQTRMTNCLPKSWKKHLLLMMSWSWKRTRRMKRKMRN